MYFLIEDDGLFENHNAIWDKVIVDIKKIDNELSTIKSFWKPK